MSIVKRIRPFHLRLIDRRKGVASQLGNVEIEFSKPKGTLTFIDRGGFQSRNASTIHLFTEALRTIKYDLRSFNAQIYTGDFPAGNMRGMCFSYCRKRDQSDIIAIPDFVFWYWPETGIYDYQELVGQVLAASKAPPTDDRLFWIGNIRTHFTRKAFFELALQRDDILAEDIEWRPGNNLESHASDKMISTRDNNYCSLPDHCWYRYLIDLQGFGFSGRLKILLFTNRLLFIQWRQWEEFFFGKLVPFVHYVPVSETLDDLIEKLEWAREHPRDACNIAAAAQAFAMENLTREAAIKYLRNTLVERFG